MFLQQKPIPGYWYSDFAGQLIQVRALMYYKGARALIVLEGIRGDREMLKPDDWAGKELVLHSPVAQAAS